MRLSQFVHAAALALALCLPQIGQASSGGVPLPSEEWSHKGPFGQFDRAAMKRGAQVTMEVCMGCHSVKYIKYDHLRTMGFSESEIQDFAAANDKTKKDRMLTALDPEDAMDSYGIIPPDLSLMVKARKGYENYTYAMLVGYPSEETLEKVEAAMEDEALSDEEIKSLAELLHMDVTAPDKVKDAVARIQDGDNFNTYFPGHFLAMPQPLSDDAVEYTDGTKATLAQMSHDVTVFLSWAAEPTMEERKSTGMVVMLYLIVLSALLYALKRRVWAKLH